MYTSTTKVSKCFYKIVYINFNEKIISYLCLNFKKILIKQLNDLNQLINKTISYTS